MQTNVKLRNPGIFKDIDFQWLQNSDSIHSRRTVEGKRCLSVAISKSNIKKSDRLVKNGIFLLERRLTKVHFRNLISLTICIRCQQHGHSIHTCSKFLRCKLYTGEYSTNKHCRQQPDCNDNGCNYMSNQSNKCEEPYVAGHEMCPVAKTMRKAYLEKRR